MTLEQHQKHIKILIGIGIVLATLIAYEPIRHNGFVNCDDTQYVTENPNIYGGITRDSVIWAFTTSYDGYWRPISELSHMLDYEIYGSSPLGHHITSVLIHAVNALLLFLALSKLTNTVWRSAFVAAAFALHPIHVESVAWVAERKDVLSGLFWMLTLLAYHYYARQPNGKRYMFVLLTFAMGLMSKPMVVTLPFVLLLLDWWPMNRLLWRKKDPAGVIREQNTSAAYQKASFERLLVEKFPMIIISVISSVITFIGQAEANTVISLEKLPLQIRVINSLSSYFSYIVKMLYPKDLVVLYLPPPEIQTNAAMLMVVGIIVLLVLGVRGRRWLIVGLLWYLGTLLPVIGIVQFGIWSMADRYTYLPSIGVFIVIAWGAEETLSKIRYSRAILVLASAAALVAMMFITRMQVSYWRNSITLWEHTLKVTKNHGVAENNYAIALDQEGRLDEGVLHLRNAVKINPNYPSAWLNLGILLSKQERFDEAVSCYNELLRLDEDSVAGYNNMAIALEAQKKYDEAIKCLTTVLRRNPNYPNIHKSMGFVLLEANRPNEAISYFEEALRRNKEQAEVYANLGNAYIQLGKFKEAIANLTEAIRIKPDRAESLNNFAWLLATAETVSTENTGRAVAMAQRSCELTEYENPDNLDTLAAAYAAAERFDDAVNTISKAIDIAEANNAQAKISGMQERLKLYKTGQRYIQK